MSSRAALAGALTGAGIEVGPGHQPLVVSERAVVRYVDRWAPVDNRRLFPELASDAEFPEPDVIADVDAEGLTAIESGSQDFVICSHVIEHLADPLRFLDETHRVLRPGGVALILLPDRRCTFDRDREPTPLSCLVRDHAAGATSPDDDHIVDFLLGADHGHPVLIPEDPSERAELFEWHRLRSVHVHCWTEDEFPEVLVYCARELDHCWECLDRLTVAENGMEFGYLLRRSRRRPRRLANQLRGG